MSFVTESVKSILWELRFGVIPVSEAVHQLEDLGKICISDMSRPVLGGALTISLCKENVSGDLIWEDITID